MYCFPLSAKINTFYRGAISTGEHGKVATAINLVSNFTLGEENQTAGRKEFPLHITSSSSFTL
jgi:hypothetical protein